MKSQGEIAFFLVTHTRIYKINLDIFNKFTLRATSVKKKNCEKYSPQRSRIRARKKFSKKLIYTYNVETILVTHFQ